MLTVLMNTIQGIIKGCTELKGRKGNQVDANVIGSMFGRANPNKIKNYFIFIFFVARSVP
jgi:hypothetical protein